MKSWTVLALLALLCVAASASVVTETVADDAAKVVVEEAAAPAATTTETAAPVVDTDRLIREYLKLKEKLALADAAAAAPADGTAAPAATYLRSHFLKNQRKVEKSRAKLAALEAQLTAAGVDLVAHEQARLAQLKAEDDRRNFKINFTKAWNEYLISLGRQPETVPEFVDGQRVKKPEEVAADKQRAALSPLEKAKANIARLEYKLERERFKIQYLENLSAETPAATTA